jgi:voltage-gated potassium channel
MISLHQSYVAIILVTLTLILQSVGMATLIEWIKAQFPNGIHQLRSIVLVVRFTSLLVCLHMLEICLWASFYRWKCFATWEAAFYFSAANYATVGAGDLVLKQVWRTMGPVESVTGVLMCGLSASFLFAIVTRLVELEDPGLVSRAGSPPSANGAGELSGARQRETMNISDADAIVART